MSYVYRYTCPVRNEVIYIGKGSRADRKFAHLGRKDKHPLTQRIGWIRKQGLEPLIDVIVDGIDDEFACLVEQEVIAKYGRKDLGRGPLLNLTDGGEGILGLKQPREVVEKRAAKLRGRVMGPRTWSNAGYKFTAEQRAKVSAASKARAPQSEETKAKRAQSIKEWWACRNANR